MCDRLAGAARGLPAVAWEGRRAEESLTPFLQIAPDIADTAEGRRIATPEVRNSVNNGPGARVFVERLPGSQVYMAKTLQGSLHCVSAVFVEAKAGQPARRAAAPAEYGEGDLCWNQTADFGRVMGEPVFLEHGTVSQGGPDEHVRLVPWTGAAWAAGCTVDLRFADVFGLKEVFCGEQAVCQAARDRATEIAKTYDQWRRAGKDPARMAVGLSPPPEALEAVQRAKDAYPNVRTPDFPTFGRQVEEQPVYSYSGFAFFPVRLDGRWYVAAIGHDGVGWRENNLILFSVFSWDGEGLKPLAGFEIGQTNGGVARTVVSDPGPAAGGG